MKNTPPEEILEGVFRFVAKMKVKIQNQRPVALFFFHSLLEGDGDVIEIAETPAGIRAGVVAGGRTSRRPAARPGEFRGHDGAPSRRSRPLGPFERLMPAICERMHQGQIFVRCRGRSDELDTFS